MDWANEQYILVYIRDSGDWLMWSWQTRAVMLFLLRKVNRAGILDLGKGKLRALAKILEMPELELSEAIAPLLEDGCVQVHEEKLIIPNFIPAQEAKHSDKARKQLSRERERARLLSQPVTGGHTESHEVTLPYPTLNNPTPAEQSKGAAAAPVREEPRSEPRLKSVPPPKPESSEAAPPSVSAPELPMGEPRADRPGAIAGQVMGAVASGDSEQGYDLEILEVARAIRADPKLRGCCDPYDVAMRAMPVGNRKPVRWLLAAVKQAADKTPPGEQGHATLARLVGFLGHAKAPKADEKPPGLRYRDFKPDKEQVPSDQAAKNLERAKAAMKLVGNGGGT